MSETYPTWPDAVEDARERARVRRQIWEDLNFLAEDLGVASVLLEITRSYSLRLAVLEEAKRRGRVRKSCVGDDLDLLKDEFGFEGFVSDLFDWLEALKPPAVEE